MTEISASKGVSVVVGVISASALSMALPCWSKVPMGIEVVATVELEVTVVSASEMVSMAVQQQLEQEWQGSQVV